MNLLTPVYEFMRHNPELVTLVGLIVVISYPKLPLPDKFVGKWYYFPYLVLHQLLARASVLEWNKTGGALKVPGTMTPSLESARRSETLANLAESLKSFDGAMPTEPPPLDVPHQAHITGEWDKTAYIDAEEGKRLRAMAKEEKL